MKLKSLLGTFIALAAMTLMAVGVQAATYSVGALTNDEAIVDGIGVTSVAVPVVVTTDDAETTAVNGYAMYFEYDATAVEPVLTDDAYAVAGESFADTTDNPSVIVSDVVEDNGTSKVIVAWASAQPVTIDAATSEIMANVNFNVLDASADTQVNVSFIQIANNGDAIADAGTYSVVGTGTIDLVEDVQFILGDVNGDSKISNVDSTLLFQYVSGSIDLGTLKSMVTDPDNVELRSDVNGDTKISNVDSTLLFQYVSGAITSFS